MTEAEWLACIEPTRMLEFLEGRVSDRKVRLFCCACCRRFWDKVLMHGERAWNAVETSERYADGQASEDELDEARRQAEKIVPETGADYLGRAVEKTAWSRSAMARWAPPAWSTWPSCVASWAAWAAVPAQDENGTVLAGEELAQADLLRDIVGDPFAPKLVSPAWLTAEVVGLAQVIYDDRTFNRLGALADALEAVGCTEYDVLEHCRRPGEHVRGCWAVDLILGKA